MNISQVSNNIETHTDIKLQQGLSPILQQFEFLKE